MAIVALDWPAPAGVKAFYTTREGGYSAAPYDSFNLALHVNDRPALVQQNRQHLREFLLAQGLPDSLYIQYLQQVHGTDVYPIDTAETLSEQAQVPVADVPMADVPVADVPVADVPVADVPVADVPVADAAITSLANRVCLVMTADCLPVFFTDVRGDQVGVAHAGWRGLVAGVLEHTVAQFRAGAGELMAFLGPAIGPAYFEVGPEVKQQFLASPLGAAAAAAFSPSQREQHFYADLYRLATLTLQRAGVQSIYGGNFCTFADEQHFFSYRRDGDTGRMASLILKTGH